MDEASYRTLLGAARIAFHTRNGTIFDQLERAEATALANRDADLAALATAEPSEERPRPTATPKLRAVGKTPALADELAFWNGFGGFDRNGRDYVVRLSGERADAAALGQRHRKRLVRLPHLGRRRILHLEPQQPRFPADALVERPGHQPARRSDLCLRPCQRQGVLALCRDRPRHLGGLRSPPWPGLLHLQRKTRSADDGGDAACRRRRPGEDLAADIAQLRFGAAAASRLRLCRMGARRQSPALGALHRPHAGRQDGCRACPQRLQPRLR